MRLFFLLSFLMLSCPSGAFSQELTEWTMSRKGAAESYNVTVPCTVAGALAENSVLPEDILEAMNYAKVDKSIFDGEWTFTTTFDTKCKKDRHFVLEFDGIGFRADISLNGVLLASSDTTAGPYIKREYDVTGIVGKHNTLDVTVTRAREGDLNHGYVDWNPRPLGECMGITGKVFLKQNGSVDIKDVYVRPELNVKDFSSADLFVNIPLCNYTGHEVSGTLTISYENGTADIPVTVPAGGTTVRLSPTEAGILHVANPRVWWTWDLGTPEMYSMTASFKAGRNVSDSKDVAFGIRSITSEVVDNHLQFYLNGRRVLVKGAGWTDDIFMRDTHESNRLQVEYVKDMNLNCIRFENLWGKDDNIYDCCDRLGLLAMVGFSCQWEWEDYCGLPEYSHFGCINDQKSMDMAVKYFKNQIIRLHNHPAVICWLTGSDRIPNPELEARYMEVYKEYEYRPYVCSAKNMTSKFGGPSGTKMAGPYEYVGPDYWYIDEELGGAFGFNTETGIGLNMPQLSSIRKMIPEDELWPVGSSWDYHCTASSSAMNNTDFIETVMDAEYGRPATLEEYVSRAHAIDYDATRAMFEAFRCNIPTSTGIIQWMLNSAWPALYWQLYDWYMMPTAGYYGTKKACEPVQLIYNYKDKSVYVVNESGKDCRMTAQIEIYDSASKLICNKNIEVAAADNRSEKIFQLPEHDGGVFLALGLSAAGKAVADNFYCIPAENNSYDNKEATWYYTPITKYADMTFVSSLPEAEVKMSTRRTAEGYEVTLSNNSAVISYQNILRIEDGNGEVIVPAIWSDNFLSVLPGETKTISCKVGKAGNIEVQTWNTRITK